MTVSYHRKGFDDIGDYSRSTVITADVSSKPYYFDRKGIKDSLDSGNEAHNKGSESRWKSLGYNTVLSALFDSAKTWFSWIDPLEQENGKDRTISNTTGANYDSLKRGVDEESTPRKKIHLDSLLQEKEHLREQLQHSITPTKEVLKLPKDPFHWDNTNEENHTESSPTRVQYGTRLYRKLKHKNQQQQSTALIAKPSDEVSYLKNLFNGEYHVPIEMQKERENQLKLLSIDNSHNSNTSTNSSNNNIVRLTERIKALILENRKSIGPNTERGSTNDDIVIIRERKLDPLEEKRKQIYSQTLKFDRSLLTFEEEFKSYSQLIEERRKIVEQVRKTAKPQKLIPDLSTEDLLEVKATFTRSDNAVLSSKYMLEVTVRDFKTLAPRRWLNDTIIEFFMKYVEQNTAKTVAFNSFFYSTLADRGYQGVRRWMKRKKVDILDLNKIFVPINLNDSHWTLGIIEMKQHKIYYLDSLSSGMNSVSFLIMKNLQSYVMEESKQKLGEDFELCHIACPQQPNGFDCGIYVCLNTLYMSKDYTLSFDFKDAANMRNYIGHLILSK
ncbi:Ulp1 [Kluyveromyces lactis]|nr:Ulp1 [Kluyveromyces lactis]